jgi:hypothetical protein
MPSKSTKSKLKSIPVHQWTHDGDYVLIVKCINRDGTTYGGFVWPESGPVKPDYWSRTPDCNSGGLFGWPWGMGIGDGRTPDACAKWIVFRAKPENVIKINDNGLKVKAVPGKDGELPEVVFYGSQAAAMAYTHVGRIAWIERNSTKKTSGNYSSASSTGDYGSASSTGDYGSASSTGYCGSSSSTGYRGSSSSTGDYSSSCSTGYCGSASSTGYRGSSSSTGYRGSSSSTGYRGSSSSTGYCGSSCSTGYRGSSCSTGYRGSSSSTGDYGSASSTGIRSIAAATGNCSRVEAGSEALAVATGDIVHWTVRKGAKLVVGWFDDNDVWQAKLFDSASMNVSDGDILTINRGEITNKQEVTK